MDANLLPGGRNAGVVDALEDFLEVAGHDDQALDASLQRGQLQPYLVQQVVVAQDLQSVTRVPNSYTHTLEHSQPWLLVQNVTSLL